jgi:hypothetical protein
MVDSRRRCTRIDTDEYAYKVCQCECSIALRIARYSSDVAWGGVILLRLNVLWITVLKGVRPIILVDDCAPLLSTFLPLYQVYELINVSVPIC